MHQVGVERSDRSRPQAGSKKETERCEHLNLRLLEY